MQRLSESRRAFLATFLTTIGAAVPASLVAASRKKIEGPKPNLLLILADELPAGTLGCYGKADAKTPHIDALARRGTHFQNAIACSKPGAIGRATVLSGRTPMQTASSGGSGEIFLSDVLAGSGYDVGFSGEPQPGHGVRWADTNPVQFIDQQKPGGKPFFLTVSLPGVQEIEQQLPQMIAKLHERGLDDSTLIVLTASGGSVQFPRVPLIFCWPGRVPVQGVRPEFVSTYDLVPTICDALGVTVPDRSLCGRSFLPIVFGKPMPKKSPWRTKVYSSFGEADMASDTRFVLVLSEGQNKLFDLRNDPLQRTNQFNNRNFITTRDEFRRNLTQWKTQFSH